MFVSSRYLAALIALVVLLLLTDGMAGEQPPAESAFPAIPLGEFCGDPPPKLDCPRTGAIRCVCYLSGRKTESSKTDLPGLTPLAVSAKAPKHIRRIKLLPIPSAISASLPWSQEPPTPPPRR